MLPTVRQVLSTPLLAASDQEILAGQSHLDRPVRWLHPAEVADIAHLLRGDEIVLTTGIFLSDSAKDIGCYVSSLADAGVAGLIIELGRRWAATLPQALITACEHAGLVLVALHREVRFAAVVEEVGGRILEARVDDLAASERIHETFTRLDVDAAGPDDILAAVVRLAAVPVVLESARHQIINYDTAGRPTTEVLTDWNRRSRAVTLSGRVGYDRHTGWLMTVVGSRGDDWGRLILMTATLPSRRDYVLVERAAATLSLHQMRARARDSLERTTHNTLLKELRDDRFNDDLLLRCEAANFTVRHRRFVALALRQKLDGEHTKKVPLTDIASAVTTATRAHQTPALVGLDTDHVIALLSLPATAKIGLLMGALAGELGKVMAVTIARGELVHRLQDCFRTLIDARTILASTDISETRPWVTLADVHVRGLLHLLRDDERLDLYVRRELGALLAYDEQRGTALTTLLTVFLDTRGSKADAAKRLLLSRPVLYERLAKIESILGVELDDPRIRTSLHVAVLAKELRDAVSESPAHSDTA
ncbi:PucR family transcriptional regulator [Mycolicibacterium goodii]|uniref:PucR family transcriptional regulator n=1 Tax=Mycolicibacterium goodii TaxID=134601 RepID=UPI001BDC5E2B|nr:PucR family transcriptional regulator [Mycolicibacterium goodii]MBU8813849.1 PucR family transcriptional regulator [Mycolicibacterium goodii]